MKQRTYTPEKDAESSPNLMRYYIKNANLKEALCTVKIINVQSLIAYALSQGKIISDVTAKFFLEQAVLDGWLIEKEDKELGKYWIRTKYWQTENETCWKLLQSAASKGIYT